MQPFVVVAPDVAKQSGAGLGAGKWLAFGIDLFVLDEANHDSMAALSALLRSPIETLSPWSCAVADQSWEVKT